MERFACVFTPPGASATSQRPLVIWLHGGSGTATGVYNFTMLRARAEAFDLSGNSAAPGFILASVQSRNLHWPYGRLNGGRHHDTARWELSENRDVENLDRLIDTLVAQGTVDPQRIHVMGWSEGGMLSQLYAFSRHQTATPGGHRVASVAIYSATSPFDRAIDETQRCIAASLPTANVPMMVVSRTCDVVPCDAAQKDALWADGSFADVIDTEQWRAQLMGEVQNPNVTWSLIGRFGVVNPGCATSCGVGVATLNHLIWPDGVVPSGSVDQELTLINFLRDHPLPP